MSDAIEDERKRAIAAIHWVFSADGTVGERAMAQEAIHKINDPTFMPALTAYETAKGGGVDFDPRSEAAYFASIWKLSNYQMTELEKAFTRSAITSPASGERDAATASDESGE